MSKTVIVTGASRGIGRAIALAYANDGYNVVINYLNSKSKAFEIKKMIEADGGSAEAIKADVSCRSEAESLISSAVQKYGKIDVLVNNAGIAEQALFTDITEQMWDRIFNVNVKGTFNCIQAVLPGMIHRKSGKIINISSVWGITGASCEVHYSASKAAVIGLTKALAKEVGLSGITVNCIAPGVIDTDMNSLLDSATINALKEETPLNRIGTADDIAQTALFLASDKAGFITGQIISVNGGFLI
jgi:3-oxoacyl-[acyl-carrier protein] reductase